MRAVIGEHLLDNAVWSLQARFEQLAFSARLHVAYLLGNSVTGIDKEKLQKPAQSVTVGGSLPPWTGMVSQNAS